MKEIESSRAPQVLTIDHDESVNISSSEEDDDDDDVSDEEVAACSELLDSSAHLSQPDSLPGIGSGQHC